MAKKKQKTSFVQEILFFARTTPLVFKFTGELHDNFFNRYVRQQKPNILKEKTSLGEIKSTARRIIKKYLYRKQKGLCALCGKRLPYVFSEHTTKSGKSSISTLDHYIPTVKGGNNRICNFQLLHARCNHGRGHEPFPNTPWMVVDLTIPNERRMRKYFDAAFFHKLKKIELEEQIRAIPKSKTSMAEERAKLVQELQQLHLLKVS